MLLCITLLTLHLILIKQLGHDKNRKWHDLIENIDTTKTSMKAWYLIKKLSGDQIIHST